MANLYAIACRMADAAYHGQGGSWSADTGEAPEHGYMVSIRRHGLRMATRPTLAIIRAWMESVGRPVAVYYGLWQDGDGQWYLDVSINMADLDAAIAFGREERQDAIWGVERGEAISLKRR
jgi:hypothetical protein